MQRFLDALRTVPRIDAAEWAQLGLVTRWAIAARVAVLPMTALSAMLGGLLAQPRPISAPAGRVGALWPLWFAPQAFAFNRRFAGLLFLGVLLQSAIVCETLRRTL